jgi:hypothetical protein
MSLCPYVHLFTCPYVHLDIWTGNMDKTSKITKGMYTMTKSRRTITSKYITLIIIIIIIEKDSGTVALVNKFCQYMFCLFLLFFVIVRFIFLYVCHYMFFFLLYTFCFNTFYCYMSCPFIRFVL